MTDMITIIDVFRDLGLEVEPEVSWSIGARVRDFYISMYGEPPEKELRTKTCGIGSHCLAIYPESMRPHIVRIILDHRTEARRQLSLPF